VTAPFPVPYEAPALEDRSPVDTPLVGFGSGEVPISAVFR
jgi:hypothetical protein